jgi:3D (Asp-Asp-Asp) domain-containing protein
MSLPLIALLLLAGPAKTAAPADTAHHHDRGTKTLSAARTTVASSKSGQKKAATDHKAVATSKPAHTVAVKTSAPVKHVAEAHKTPVKHVAEAHETPVRHVAEAHKTLVRHIAGPEQPSQPARVPLGTFVVTCYDLYGYTADGAVAGMESVAVDPSVIPLGTTIYVPGIGERTADDTGGMIIGNHIDIWEPTYGQCADWGVRYLPIYRVG